MAGRPASRGGGQGECWGKRAQARPGIGLSLGSGQAVVADAADFGAGDGDLHFEVAGDLFLQLFVEAGFKFADFAAAKAGDVNVVARAVGFVVVAVAAEVKVVEFVDEAFFLEKFDGALDGD